MRRARKSRVEPHQLKVHRGARSPVINRSINQSITQPIIDYAPVSSASVWQACQNGDIEYLQQYLNELIDPSIDQSDQSINQSIKQSINVLNEAYETPLHIAASNNQLQCVSLLLSFSQALSQSTNHSTKRPTSQSINQSINQSTNQLIAINQTDRENGWTALHRACEKGHLSIAALLIRAGANPTIVDYDRSTAFDLLITRHQPGRFIAIDQPVSQSIDQSVDDLDSPVSRAVDRDAIWRRSLSHHLYAFGSNSSFTLGIQADGVIRKPIKSNFFHINEIDVCYMSLIKSASFALSSAGEVFAMGTGTHYRLGLGDTDTVIQPRRVSIPAKVTFIDSCDKYSCAVSNDRSDVFVWGHFEWLTPEVTDSYRIVDHILPTPVRMDWCRSYRVVSCSCSQYRLCLLTGRGELFYIGQAMEDQSVTVIPKPVLAMSHLSISKVIATRDCIIVLTKDGEIYQQVRKDRRAHRVALKFSTASMFTSRSVPYRSSPRNEVSAGPTSPILTSISSLPGPALNRRLPAVKKIVVSPSCDRALAVTDQGEVYWWKPLDVEPMQALSLTHSPPLRSMGDPSDTGGGRRSAHLVQGLSFVRVVDACLGKGHTTVVTSLGDVYHWGPNSLTQTAGHNQSHQPHRIHYLHAADRVWCTDTHVFVTTVYHRVDPPTVAQLVEQHLAQPPRNLPSLRSMCEFSLLPAINFDSLFPALSYAVALSLPSMFDFACQNLFNNLNILIHPLMKKASLSDLSVIEAAYQRGVAFLSPAIDYLHNCRMDSSNDIDDDRFAGVFPFALSSQLTEHSLSLLTKAIDHCRDEKVFGFRLDDEPLASYEPSENESDWTTDSQDENLSEASEIEYEHNGQVNLFAGHQRERQERSQKIKDAERRKQRRLRKLDERVNQAGQAWRVGLSSDEVAVRLKSELRTLIKKEKRREAREIKAVAAAHPGTLSSSPVVRAADPESRDFFIRSERIRNELRSLADNGSAVAAEWVQEQTPQVAPLAVDVHPLDEQKGQDPDDEKKHDVSGEEEALPGPVKQQSKLRADAVSFDVTLNRPVRALTRQDGSPVTRTQGTRPAVVSLVREVVTPTAVSAATPSSSPGPAAKANPSKSASGWTGSPIAASPLPAQLANPVTSLCKSPQAPSIFAAIQREQADQEAKRIAQTLTRNPSKQSAAKGPAPSFTPTKHAPGAAAWGSPVAPVSASPVGCSPMTTPLSTPMQAMSLADIQAEESKKQKQLQQQRQHSKPHAKQAVVTPVRSTGYSPPTSAASPHFSLADFVPLSSPVDRKPVAAARTWSTPAVATSSNSPPASFREIQQTEAQHFKLPTTITNPQANGRSLMTSSPWGRHAGLHDTSPAAPITAIAAMQLAEEERRIEAEALQEAQRLIKAQEVAEAKERKARAKAAKKLRDAAARAQKPASACSSTDASTDVGPPGAVASQPKRPPRQRKPKPAAAADHGAADHPTAAARALRAHGSNSARAGGPPREQGDRKPKQPRAHARPPASDKPSTVPIEGRAAQPHARPHSRVHDATSRVTEVH